MPPPITIRKAETAGDYLACQSAQRQSWGLADESYVVPIATMVGAQEHGGLVLGAFLPDGQAVGVTFAFLGRAEGRIVLYSQLTGIIPGYQGQGLGYLLKTAQRDFARAEEIPCIAWAFDPLQAGNAHFNLAKLGATSNRFIPNMYGPRTDALNRNATTDRLIALWETETSAPGMRPAEEMPRLILKIATKPVFGGILESGTDLRLDIPGEINKLRILAPEMADYWTQAVREAFLAAFATGYRATGFERSGSGASEECFYRLQPPSNRPLP